MEHVQAYAYVKVWEVKGNEFIETLGPLPAVMVERLTRQDTRRVHRE
jgi:hypothetical protein